jgi:hypothetical protein
LAQITLFVLLGLLVTPHHLVSLVLPILAITAVLLVIARPIGTFLCLLFRPGDRFRLLGRPPRCGPDLFCDHPRVGRSSQCKRSVRCGFRRGNRLSARAGLDRFASDACRSVWQDSRMRCQLATLTEAQNLAAS